MTTQKAILDDDSSSNASTDFTTTTSTTVSPIGITAGTRKHDPLYTPIQLPGSFSSYTDDTNQISSVHLYMAMEESSTSALVHAACRLHEAVAVTTDAFQKLIFRRTGLAPWEAATAAQMYDLPRHERSDDLNTSSTEILQQQRAMMLQTVLSVMQNTATVVGGMAGMAVDARELAVSQGFLLPLSALEQEGVASTFATFTCGASMATIEASPRYNLQWSLWSVKKPLSHVLKHIGNFCEEASITFLDRLQGVRLQDVRLQDVYNLAARVPKPPTKTAVVSASKIEPAAKYEVAMTVRRKVQDMIKTALSDSLEKSAVDTLYTVDVAFQIVKWRRLSRGIIASLMARVFGRSTRTADDDDDDLLQQARNACIQAVTAAKTARQHLPVAAAWTTVQTKV